MTKGTRFGLSEADLDYLYSGLTSEEWNFFRAKRIFVTGGSGFIGKWLLCSLLEANQRLGLGLRIEVLTRSIARFKAAAPEIAISSNLGLIQGDVRNFLFPSGPFDIVIHAATDVVDVTSPMETFLTSVEGTKRVLDFAEKCGATDYLFTSSGAIYGRHPAQPTGLAEPCASGPDPTLIKSAYAEGKRAAEWLSIARGADSGLKVKIARIYAQVGPFLALDKHFAMGNFIRDALAGRPIVVNGDGSPVRSYMYAADTTGWLLAMLVRGEPGRAWNVGGLEPISIADLAKLVDELLGSSSGVRVLGDPLSDDASRECYVPNVERALRELAVREPIELRAAILRTAKSLQE